MPIPLPGLQVDGAGTVVLRVPAAAAWLLGSTLTQHQLKWIVRRACTALMLTILLTSAVRYESPASIAARLASQLRRFERQQAERANVVEQQLAACLRALRKLSRAQRRALGHGNAPLDTIAELEMKDQSCADSDTEDEAGALESGQAGVGALPCAPTVRQRSTRERKQAHSQQHADVQQVERRVTRGMASGLSSSQGESEQGAASTRKQPARPRRTISARRAEHS